MTGDQIRQLFDQNVRELDRMDVVAASQVKGLIMELQRHGRSTFIRLHDPVPDGHAIRYDIVEGSDQELMAVAQALGFRAAGGSRLEVAGA